MRLVRVLSGQQILRGAEGGYGYGVLTMAFEDRSIFNTIVTKYKQYKVIVESEHLRRRNLEHVKRQRGLT